MYKLLAIASYEDHFLIPSTHREYAENAEDVIAPARPLIDKRTA